MISKLSLIIVSRLSANQVIPYEDKDLYIYGYFILLSHLYFFIFTSITGLIFNVVPESILFYLSFTLIRSYAGGVHAKTEHMCMICTSASIILSMVVIKMCYKYSLYTLPTILMLIAVFIIINLGPLDSKEKRLNEYEKKKYRKKGTISSIFILAISLVFRVADVTSVFLPLSTALVLEGILLIIGKAHDLKERNY